MFKIKPLCLISAAAVSVAAMTHSIPAEAAKETFERTKPHVNVGSQGGSSAQPQRPSRPGNPGKPTKPGPREDHNSTKVPGYSVIEILPDLVFHMPYPSGPLPGAPKTGYCGKQGSTALASEVVVGVRNKGVKPVPNSFVSVTMRTSPTTTSTINKPLGPLAPGAVGTVKFPLSKGAWKKGEAKFKMKIDTGNDIKEGAGESNNQREYACVEPAG